jgi:hypothetical protein
MKIRSGDIVKNRDGRIGIVLSVDEKENSSSRCLILLAGKPVNILLKNLFRVVR